MEAAKVLFVPALLIWLTGGKVGWLTLAPITAKVLLIFIGTLYWRDKVRQLRGKESNFPALLRWLSAWRTPTLVLTLA